MRPYKLTVIGLAILMIAGCKKIDFDKTANGEVINEFTLTTPGNNTAIVLNAATPNEKITMSWSPAKPGVNTTVTYKWIAALKTGGSLETPLIELAADNSGKDTKITLTQKQLDDALKAKNIADAAKTDLIWSVEADNGTTKRLASAAYAISITRFGDGVTPFVIYGPQSSSTNLEINPTSTTDFIDFKWQKATPANAAKPVKYTIYFTQDNGSTQPLFTMLSGNNGADTTLKVSWKQISDSLVAKGFTDLSQAANLKWKVLATSGNFSIWSSFENQLYILRQLRFYIVGSFTGWDINAPMELIVDKRADRYGKVYYTYVRLLAGAEFKFVKTKGDWGSAYGNTGGAAGTYNTGFNQGGNFQITTSGIYRLTIDLGTNKAYIQQKQVGIVGAVQTPNQWDPSAPIYGGYISKDKFIFIVSSNGNQELKFHDGPEWNNSTPDRARWWGIGTSAGTLDVDGNGNNLVANTAPYTRLIWDGTDPQQVKYQRYQGKLRIVGGAPVVGDWNPDNAPDMTYLGNGVWQKTVTFTATTEFKFVSADGWNLNYGDDGGGKIKEGGNNLSKGAGTYTITVDEYNRTYTVL